ncbi:XapX domain-containing protein [Burkholderia multivorans]|uniref:XapX domain-containing protein n=1 Tax=Burkholderia multivorans TaxID=87883 RepID=UPI002159B25E|nr:XapX domain-containing protein [Burkholderia multivorans]
MADTITARRSLAAALRSFFLQANPIRSHDFDRTVPAPVGHQRAFLMKAHSFSLLAGLLAVAIDGTLGVNSAAPARRALQGHRPDTAWRDAHMSGALPTSGTRARKPS